MIYLIQILTIKSIFQQNQVLNNMQLFILIHLNIMKQILKKLTKKEVLEDFNYFLIFL